MLLDHGTAGLPITFSAHPGESPVLDGTGIAVPPDEGLFHIVGRQYLRVIGLRVVHSAYAGIYADLSDHLLVQGNSTYDTVSSGIGVWGSTDVTIEGNRVEESNGGGWQECITVAGTDTFTVRDNEVLDCHKEGICLKDGSAHGQVYRNRTRRTDSGGIYVDAWDKHTYDIDLFQNVVRETLLAKAGIGLSSEQGGLLEDVRVYDNVAFGNGFAGLQVTECCIASHPMHLYGECLRFDHRRRCWLAWREHHWSQDHDASVERLAKEAARERCQRAASIVPAETYKEEVNWAVRSESRKELTHASLRQQLSLP